MEIDTLIEAIQAHSNKIELPKYYKEDVEIDFAIAKKYGIRDYVFLLRECGSVLFPLRTGNNPIHVSFHFNDKTAKVFFLKSGTTEFQEISFEQADELINQTPSNPNNCNTFDQLLHSVTAVLSDKNVTHKMFHTPHLETDTAIHWNEWKNWFHDNPVMHKYMQDALCKLNQLTH